MDRYNEVKLLLKSWEQNFVKEHKRKPAKEDVDDAPEETKNLYKEYRSLKLTKENDSNNVATTNNTEESGSASQKDCWGSHLNRSALPASSPRPLTSQDRDALKASVQNYGFKLKTNLVSLSKNNKSVSLKKTGRLPLNSLKRDDQHVPKNNVVTSSHEAQQPRIFSLGSVKPKLGTSKIDLPEPDEPLEQFPSISEPPTDSLSPIRTCVPPVASDVEKDSHFSCGGLAATDLGGPQITSTMGRPSLASHLSGVDRKWLERCQVFGELGAEEKPGGGNQDASQTNEKTVENRADEKDSKTDISVNSAPQPRTPPEYIDEAALPQESDESLPKKKWKKRQRDAEEMLEGGARKRRRKKTLEDNVEKDKETAQEEEGKKKARRKKAKEDSELEDNKAVKVPNKVPQENLLGEVEEDFNAKRSYHARPVSARGSKAAEGNFVKINLKKKSHVKGYALRGMALRKQLSMQKFQLKGERFGGGGGFSGRGRRGGFRGGYNRQGDTCFKCGGTGHWAVHCKGAAATPAIQQPVEEEEEEPFQLPTLEEVARATGTLQDSGVQDDRETEDKDQALLNVIRPDYERPAPPSPVEPLYGLVDDGNVQATPEAVFAALRELGYNSFRAGQEEAIMRILSGLSTLVVLSTGMGKSLCYQLPAYLYAKRSNCITLVISPLVSLMDDQLFGVSAKLKAACIHSNMTMKQREIVIQKVKAGQVCVLLLSPEALVGGGASSGPGCLPSAQELPPVAFACIDEAHCLSEWSHNFRPCYLRLCKVLRERLGVRCLLGLTATATLSTALDIAHHLEIHDEAGIAVRSAAVPANLQLSVSMDEKKDQALVSLLKGERFGCLDSVIVYCTRREETSRVAALLRTCLQGVLLKENKHLGDTQTEVNPVGLKKKEIARKKIRKPLKWQAESYHAGLSASERRRVQNNFMCGELRIVVATVAFGMGLDKSDVRGIIHYNMPKSFESYVQEIGRAGRDGAPAHCHLFLDPEGMDLHELRRHIYSDTVDYYTVKRLVQKAFPPCKCKQIRQKQQQLIQEEITDGELLEMLDQENGGDASAQQETPLPPVEVEKVDDSYGKKGDEQKDESSSDWLSERVCHTHERAVPIQETVEALDITEEGIETLLCYLELHPQRLVELLPPTLSTCKISCYQGPRELRKITKICPPVAVVLARRRAAGLPVESCDGVEFDVVEVADTMGWQLPLVKRGLRQLRWITDGAGGRSGILVEFSSLSFYFRSYGDLNDEELDKVCRFLHGRVRDRETSQLYQLAACFRAFQSVAFKRVSCCVDDLDGARSLRLKGLLAEYFDKRREGGLQAETLEDSLEQCKLLDWENQIRADIRSFLSHRSDEKFSGRAVARIFHGIGSPCFPAQTYGRDRRYWRKYIQFDFNQLIKMATQEIIRFK